MRLGRFRLVRALGSGGMSAVWLAHDDVVDLPVAIKWMDPRIVQPWLIELEARAVAMLDHPNVVHVFDLGRVEAPAALPPLGLDHLGLTDGAPWFAMELLPDGPLEPASTWDEARRVLEGLLAGLAHAHARGLVHWRSTARARQRPACRRCRIRGSSTTC